MRKRNLNWLVYLIIIVVILIGSFIIYKVTNNKSESNLIYITATELENKINNKDSFILVISQTGCSHCEQYLPVLNRTLKNYDINAYVVNLTNLNDEEELTLSKYVNVSGTPTTIFYNDGEEKTTLNRFVGSTTEDKLIERFKTLGYIE